MKTKSLYDVFKKAYAIGNIWGIWFFLTFLGHKKWKGNGKEVKVDLTLKHFFVCFC
jgi:hypothetical protein